jgi:hypothetical protein
VDFFWLKSKGSSPHVEPTEIDGRSAIWISGGDRDWLTVVLLTEDGKRYCVSGTLIRDELQRVAATLPR